MALSDHLQQLERAERNRLETFLLAFDQDWSPDRFDEYLRLVASDDSPAFRMAALAEMVKIDLFRRWRHGDGRMLEQYLRAIPELGTPSEVDVELILAEYEARCGIDPTCSIDEYSSRFPRQFETLERLVAERDDLAADAGASLDTSRNGGAGDTDMSPSDRKSTPLAPLPQVFGRYRIMRPIGSGAMGTVYLARDTQLDRVVALKTPSFAEDRSELIERFYREAQAAARLRHRNICPIYDVGQIDGRHFISMAYIHGVRLSRYVNSDRLPRPRQAARIVLRIATALREAHRQNIIHRDLKPANVMIDADGEPIVMDFGLARRTDLESTTTQDGTIIGTPAYMAPELLAGKTDQAGPATDVYSLGVLFYELLAGRLPFRGSLAAITYQATHVDPTPPSELREGIDSELESICLRMMARRPEQRTATMQQVVESLTAWIAQPRAPKRVGDSRDKASEREKEEEERAGGHSRESASEWPFEWRVPNDGRTSRHAAARRRRRAKRSRKRPVVVRAVLLVAAVAAMLAAVPFLIRTPYGTVRIETFGDTDGLEVLLDGDQIHISNRQWEGKRRAARHFLVVRVGGQELKIGSPTTIRLPGGDRAIHQLSLELNGAEVHSNAFEVVRGETTVLRIRHVRRVARSVAADHSTPHPSAPRPPAAEAETPDNRDPDNRDAGRPSSARQTWSPAESPPSAPTRSEVAEVRVRVRIDGLDELRIYQKQATWLHRRYRHPKVVYLNNVAWDLIHSRKLPEGAGLWLPNDGETSFMPRDALIGKANVEIIKGRGRITIRRLSDHIYIAINDIPFGADDYELLVRVPLPPKNQESADTADP